MTEPWQRLPALSLRQLQYFVTLAQLRHFTDTASKLAISQPALSSALRQIETVLGGKLVNRTASAVTLTELGNAILPHAQRVLSVAQLAFDDMQHIVQAGGEGTVRIGLIPSVSSLLFPLLPRTLAQAFPRLRVEFHDQTNDALVAQLLKGQIDFGIGALDNSVPDQLNVFPRMTRLSRSFTATIRWPRRRTCPGSNWQGGISPCSQKVIFSVWLRRSRKATVCRCRHAIRWTTSKLCMVWCARNSPWRFYRSSIPRTSRTRSSGWYIFNNRPWPARWR